MYLKQGSIAGLFAVIHIHGKHPRSCWDGELLIHAIPGRVGKMPAFMSKVHATGVYWHFPE